MSTCAAGLRGLPNGGLRKGALTGPLGRIKPLPGWARGRGPPLGRLGGNDRPLPRRSSGHPPLRLTPLGLAKAGARSSSLSMSQAFGPSGLSMRHGSSWWVEDDDADLDVAATLSSSGVESPVTPPGDHCCSLLAVVLSSLGRTPPPPLGGGEADNGVSDEVVSRSRPNSLSVSAGGSSVVTCNLGRSCSPGLLRAALAGGSVRG